MAAQKSLEDLVSGQKTEATIYAEASNTRTFLHEHLCTHNRGLIRTLDTSVRGLGNAKAYSSASLRTAGVRWSDVYTHEGRCEPLTGPGLHRTQPQLGAHICQCVHPPQVGAHACYLSLSLSRLS